MSRPSFTQIPSNRRTPGTYIEIDSSQAVRGLPGLPHKTLALGQILAAGETAAHVPVQITDPEQAARAFGRGSMLHAECLRFRGANDTTEFWAVGIEDDAAGTAAVKSTTLSKVVPADDFGAGMIVAYVGGRSVRVAVATDDTPATIVAALVAAATEPMLCATLSIDGGTPEKLLATAKHKGAAAGEFDLRISYYSDEVLPVNLAVGATVIETAGAGNPEIDDALAAVGSEWYTEIVMPYLDGANYAATHAFLKERFDALTMNDGLAFTVDPDTYANVHAFGKLEGTNSPFITTLPSQKSPTPPWEIAAAYAGLAAEQTQIDPARQLRGLALTGILPPAVADRFSPTEIELLLHAGVSAVSFEGGAFRVDRCVTNYQENELGADDTAYLDLVTMTNLAYLRYSERTRIDLRFPRSKLADDGTRIAEGQAVVTPELMEGELVGLYKEWELAGLVEDTKGYIKRLVVARDGDDSNRLNALQSPDLINNFRILAAMMQFRN